MQLHSKTSRIATASVTHAPVKRIAMALPLAITVGCAGPVIDYTVSEAEYAALTAPAGVADEAAESIAQATSNEPTLAAAIPAPENGASVALKQASITASELSAEITAKETMAAKQAAPEKIAIPERDFTKEKVAALNAKVARLEANQLEALAAVAEEPTLGAAIDINRLGFSPSIYTTAGLGVSRSDPNTSAAPGFNTDDKIEPAGQVAIGVDVARFLSFEAHSADFGSTSLSPEGRINTHVQGVSALIYAGRNRDRFRRRGLNGYARIGFNQIEQSPIGDVPFTERKSNHASFGLGAEYITRFGVGFRADVVAFDDSDLQYGQFGILYRLGSKPRILPRLAAATPIPKVEEVSFSESSAPAYDVEPVLAEANHSNTRSTADDACLALNGVLRNVNFAHGSAHLNHHAAVALNNVATTLSGCGNRQVIVSAHTDNVGLATDNHELSKNRARAVSIHLVGRGIDRNNIRAVAYGESQPVASNSTPEGQKRNRRVELEVR